MSYKSYRLEDIGCWQKARQHRKRIYELAKKLPANSFKLKSQMIDAAGSICRNIAEGFGRCSFKENIQFCRIARGSTYEVRDCLYEMYDTGHINQKELTSHYNENLESERSINGYIGFLKTQLVKYPRS